MASGLGRTLNCLGLTVLAVIDVGALVAHAISPKVVLFLLAFLPQFVVVPRGGMGR